MESNNCSFVLGVESIFHGMAPKRKPSGTQKKAEETKGSTTVSEVSGSVTLCIPHIKGSIMRPFASSHSLAQENPVKKTKTSGAKGLKLVIEHW